MPATVMSEPDPRERARRSVRLAVLHALLAMAFLALFVWTQAHK